MRNLEAYTNIAILATVSLFALVKKTLASSSVVPTSVAPCFTRARNSSITSCALSYEFLVSIRSTVVMPKCREKTWVFI